MFNSSPEKNININPISVFKSILVVLAFVLAYYVRDIVLVVILAVIVASAVEPGTKWLLKKGIPRILAVLFIYSLIGIMLSVVFYFIFLPLISQSISLFYSLPEYLGELQIWNPLQNKDFFGQDILAGFSQNFSLADTIDLVETKFENLSNGFLSTASIIFGGALSFILVIVLSFYLSTESDGVTKFLKIVTPLKKESYIIDLWQRSQHKIGLWMQGQIVLAVIVAVLVFLGLTLLKVENALFLAVLAGIFEIIPLFGPILAAIPAVTLALVTNGMTIALLVVGLYIIIQQFENQLIYPLVVRKIVGISPIVSILALIIGGKLAGFIGLVISVPLATMIMEYLGDLEKDKSTARAGEKMLQ